jgi:hypothetical protein
MAGCARRRQTCIDIVFVTRCTAHCDVGARERKWRVAVIEGRSQKAGCGVAKRAVLRETRLCMVWISRAIVGSQMAGHARGR